MNLNTQGCTDSNAPLVIKDLMKKELMKSIIIESWFVYFFEPICTTNLDMTDIFLRVCTCLRNLLKKMFL